MPRKSTVLLFCSILFGAAASAPALEIGVSGSATNLFFPWADTAVTSPLVAAYPSTNYFWGGEAWVSAPIGFDGVIKVAYEHDPVLRNLVTGQVAFERGIAKISVGPLVGLFNSAAVPLSAGLAAKVEFRWPGTAYFSILSEGGLAVGTLQLSEDPQARTELAAGFYVPNAIVSGILSVKRFSDQLDGYLVTDTATRYVLTIDIFQKNVPYTVLLTTGYELRSKFFAASGATDSLGSIVVGAKVSAQVAPGYSVSADLQSAMYTFGFANLVNRGPGASAFMFSAGIGLVINLEDIRANAARGAPSAKAPASAPAAIPANAPASAPVSAEAPAAVPASAPVH